MGNQIPRHFLNLRLCVNFPLHQQPLVKTRMSAKQIVRGMLIPSYFATGVLLAECDGKEECDDTKKLVRARDLPLYADPPKPLANTNTLESEEGVLLTTIRCARQELQAIVVQAKAIRSEVSHMIDQTTKETEDAVEYLRQEENLLPRLGAIGLGGLAGYLLAIRRGIIRKMLYTSFGSGIVASVAYPNQALEYTEEVVAEAKKYAVLGYHFLNGVTRDLTGYQLPALSIGHLNISDSHHPPPDAVPSTAHLLPPTTTPTHIPLPGEQHEAKPNK
ncbi:Apolipoprotein O [Nesidiocoris tenuis]|uniref:MICOS complex subunit n=1 Tax=Nesidiocoris tenuis TaxID=355587 RepID=A0ABN7AZI4_9HEMI|nr:Apolipoprotein O [Nesidiocoris tenuis]